MAKVQDLPKGEYDGEQILIDGRIATWSEKKQLWVNDDGMVDGGTSWKRIAKWGIIAALTGGMIA